ncbi:MAG: hypothetical protein MAG458_00696 [Nitrosopumilus sp.]|nr:hypothetical protein [Nitrosopumilus sp.]
MQKIGLVVVISGGLIVMGLILLAFGNQVILEGVSQGEGIVSKNKEVIISAEFDSLKTPMGIFAVQSMNVEKDIMYAKIFNPSGNEVIAISIDKETTEKTFDILETGEYKLIIQSVDDEEIQVFGAIGPIPDEGKKLLSYVSVLILIIGMIGLIGAAILKIKNKK